MRGLRSEVRFFVGWEQVLDHRVVRSVKAIFGVAGFFVYIHAGFYAGRSVRAIGELIAHVPVLEMGSRHAIRHKLQRGEIVARQCRQRPRSINHDSTGTLSYPLIGAPHDVQCDRGVTIDSLRGTL